MREIYSKKLIMLHTAWYTLRNGYYTHILYKQILQIDIIHRYDTL